ncbi:MAG: NAD(P)H-dependent oxidoreductase [Methylobacteriaceae bacterium]|nr:NAD(P)H-dependent oxidoreductase [Methylobacteriaceae bacterium]
MRVLVVSAHPLQDGLHGVLRRAMIDVLVAAGHEVDECDLYAEGFDPVLDAESRKRYFDTGRNREGVEGYIDRLFAAQALVLCFPVWCFGPPAILKGFMDRVLIPGVSFALGDDGRMHPNLGHIRRLIAVTTYGRSRRDAWWIGDPPRKLVTRYLRWFVSRDARVRYLALYDLHRNEGRMHHRFIERVAASMRDL